jgi:hypothetical protein
MIAASHPLFSLLIEAPLSTDTRTILSFPLCIPAFGISKAGGIFVWTVLHGIHGVLCGLCYDTPIDEMNLKQRDRREDRQTARTAAGDE